MGKKTKKTKWRTLEIPAPVKNSENGDARWDAGRRAFSGNYHRCDRIRGHDAAASSFPTDSSSINCKYSSSNDRVKTLLEDEYTKITTPRQDVLFKKGYLTKRKAIENTSSENTTTDDCTSNDELANYNSGSDGLPQLMCPNTQPSYVDSSALMYGGGYEIYDPYTGSIATMVVSASASQYTTNTACQPILTSMPCRPVPLQPVQWFNPVASSDWCCSYSDLHSHSTGDDASKMYPSDSQNANGAELESSCAPEGAVSLIEDQTSDCAALYQPSYLYPSYMFGTAIYNVDGIDVEYCAPESPVFSRCESITSKKKKKKKRRRRAEETEESWESSADETCHASISCNECGLDSASQADSVELEDDIVKNHISSNADVRNDSENNLPHANVYATPFVPGSCLRPFNEITVHKAFCADSEALFDIHTITSNENGDKTYANEKYALNTANLYCKTYDNHQNEGKADRTSSSNNSDSGISSPGSEDCSQTVEDSVKNTKGGKLKTNVDGSGNGDTPQNDVTILVENVAETSSVSPTSNARISCDLNANANANVKPNENKVERDRSLSERDTVMNDDKNYKTAKNDSGRMDKEKSNRRNRSKKTSKAINNKYFSKEAKDCREANTVSDLEYKIDDENSFKNDDFTIINANIEETYAAALYSYCTIQESGKKLQRIIYQGETSETGGVRKSVDDGEDRMSACAKSDSKLGHDVLETGKYSEPECVWINGEQLHSILNYDDEKHDNVDNTETIDGYDKNFENASHTNGIISQSMYIAEEPSSALLADVDSESSTKRPLQSELWFREITQVEPAQSAEMMEIERTARCVVDEIIKCAEARAHSSITCDKLQLPITLAVTNWLNERGGFPTVDTAIDSLSLTHDKEPNQHQIIAPNAIQTDLSPDDETTKFDRLIKSSVKSKSNCVIC